MHLGVPAKAPARETTMKPTSIRLKRRFVSLEAIRPAPLHSTRHSSSLSHNKWGSKFELQSNRSTLCLFLFLSPFLCTRHLLYCCTRLRHGTDWDDIMIAIPDPHTSSACHCSWPISVYSLCVGDVWIGYQSLRISSTASKMNAFDRDCIISTTPQ